MRANGAMKRHDTPGAYERVAEEHLMARLSRASELLAGGLRRNLRQIRTLLAEAADQADGFEIAEDPSSALNTAGTAVARRDPEDAVVPTVAHRDSLRTADTSVAQIESNAPMCRLSRAMLTKAGGEPVREFLLIPFGQVQVERPLSGRDFEFTRRHAESAITWFESLGRKLAIDYEHQSFDRHNTRADGLRPAAGWVGGLQVRDDGLWATDVSWTPRARELLAAGEYRYFSPVIFWTDEDYGDVAGLGPVALTNDPAMRGVTPLAATRRTTAATSDDSENGTHDSHETYESDGENVNDVGFVAREELQEARQEVALLRRQLAAQEADMFIERGMRLGKILDSTSLDWREDFLRDTAKAEERLSRAPVLRPPGRQVTAGAAPATRDAGTSELYRRWGIEAEDLQAYERAVAAGRVR